MQETSIAIVGAGIIGASTALALQKDGHNVCLIDRQEPCAGASFGNAGAVVNGSCVPTAMPGIIIEALRMLSQPLPPLSIRAAYFPRILPWLIRLVLESRRSKVLQNATNLHALTSQAVAGWRRLTDNTELSMNMPRKMGSRRRCSEAAPSMSPSNKRPIMCLIWFPTRWDTTLTTP